MLFASHFRLSKMPRIKGRFVSKKKLNSLKNLCKGQQGEKRIISRDPVSPEPVPQTTAATTTPDLHRHRQDNAEDADSTPTARCGYAVEGRRIIDLGHVAQQMICQACTSKLHLSDIVKERRYGLASIFTVICPNAQCLHRNTVTSSKRKDDTKGPFVVNCKTILGKFYIFDHIGISCICT